MTIQTFIEKAIEGGWKRQELFHLWSDAKTPCPFFLLDPLAWQAVGTVEGWPCKKEDGRMQPVPFGWLQNMHDMINALAEGKTVEEYLETL